MGKLDTLRSSRREFLSSVAAAVPSLRMGEKAFEPGWQASAALSDAAHGRAMENKSHAFLNKRFLTFATIVRVNQIEVRRGEGIGNDETAFHTLESIAAFRNAFAQGWPGGRMTW